jgi:DNA-binding HxlR family transcriptional regulator
MTLESRFTLELVTNKWIVQIVHRLQGGPQRFGELRRGVDGISQRMLTYTLRKLETDGLVRRTVHALKPPKTEYALTPLGSSLADALGALCRWALDHKEEILECRRRRAVEMTRTSGEA